MGIVNVTPDSSAAGGLHLAPDAAASAARHMIAMGAALVDVGGESTRPGAAEVPESVEADRVLPVLDRLAGLPFGVDTRRGTIARAALARGAVCINDVTAGADPEMFPVLAESGAAVVLMHMQGTPRSMQDAPRYDDVVGEVEGHLLARAAAAEEAGIARARILIDPGIGFGKTVTHNLALLRSLPRLAGHGYPVVVGVSRKRFLGALTGRAVDARDDATTAATALAAHAGAAVVRVHDVSAAIDAVRVAAALGSRLLE
jgi:dihydropteroate synthase